MSRRELVERGYDMVAERYLELAARTEGDPRLRFLDDLAARLPDGAAVLDLGCGAGRPNLERLARRFRVTGVDVSPRQLLLASLGCGDAPGAVEESWLGAPMFFSSHPAAVNRELLAGAGFALLHDEVVAMREDGAEAAFQWALGRVA